MPFAAPRHGGHHPREARRSFLRSLSRTRTTTPRSPRPANAATRARTARRRTSIGLLLAGLVAGGGVLAAAPGQSAWSGTASLLPDDVTPSIVSHRDARPAELGLRFRVSVPSYVVGVQFYQGPRNTGRHKATLWSATGHKLARVTVKRSGKTGLRQALFHHPVSLRPRTDYVISYTTRAGHYSADTHFFKRRVSNGLITARRNAGVFSYSAGSFPTRTYAATSYAVDVVVQPKKRPRQWPVRATTGLPTTSPDTSTGTAAATSDTTSANTSTSSGPCPSATLGAPGGPDGSGGCWPGAGNTGVPAGVKLKRVPQDVTSAAQAGGANSGWTYDSSTGSLRITAAGATISGVDVRGGIDSSTAKSRMTVTDSRFRCSTIDDGNFCGALGDHSTMTDSEIGGGDNGTTFINSPGFWVGDSSAASTLRRVDIHHIVHGLHVDGGTTVVDSYIHDMPAGDRAGSDDGSAHTNCVFVSTGGNMAFRHSTFDKCGNNSGIFVQNYANTAEGIFNLTVEKSLFLSTNRNGQRSSYGVGIENKAIKGASSIHVRDNVFGQGWDVAPIEAPSGADVSGNTYVNGGGAPVVWAR